MAKRKHKPVKPEYQLDIVIPVYGQAELLSKCIEALPGAAGDTPYRLILVDDCGPEQEQLRAVYRSLNGNSKVIRNRENSGFSRTVNAGVASGASPFILLLNSDCILQPGAISALLKEFDDPEVGIVGAKLLFGDNRWGQAGKVQHAGLCRNIQGQLVHVGLGWDADHPKVNERREMQIVTGACLMIRRKTWDKVLATYRKYGDPTTGALNDVYATGYFEDAELCLAARSEGYKVIYQPEAVGLHYVGASMVTSKESSTLQRNSMIFGARCGHLVEWDEWRYL